MNFSSWYKSNLSCPLACQADIQDDQEHILKCKTLQAQLSEEQLKLIQDVYYDDIYNNTTRQKIAVRGFICMLEIRESLLEAATPASGATLVAAPPGGNRGLS